MSISVSLTRQVLGQAVGPVLTLCTWKSTLSPRLLQLLDRVNATEGSLADGIETAARELMAESAFRGECYVAS